MQKLGSDADINIQYGLEHSETPWHRILIQHNPGNEDGRYAREQLEDYFIDKAEETGLLNDESGHLIPEIAVKASRFAWADYDTAMRGTPLKKLWDRFIEVSLAFKHQHLDSNQYDNTVLSTKSDYQYKPLQKASELEVVRKGTHHQIARGDTLTKIARKYNVSLESLVEANPKEKSPWLKNINLIMPGGWVRIPEPMPSEEYTEANLGLVGVRPPETAKEAWGKTFLKERKTYVSPEHLTVELDRLSNMKDKDDLSAIQGFLGKPSKERYSDFGKTFGFSIKSKSTKQKTWERIKAVSIVAKNNRDFFDTAVSLMRSHDQNILNDKNVYPVITGGKEDDFHAMSGPHPVSNKGLALDFRMQGKLGGDKDKNTVKMLHDLAKKDFGLKDMDLYSGLDLFKPVLRRDDIKEGEISPTTIFKGYEGKEEKKSKYGYKYDFYFKKNNILYHVITEGDHVHFDNMLTEDYKLNKFHVQGIYPEEIVESSVRPNEEDDN